jgi:hypothetical protein
VQRYYIFPTPPNFSMFFFNKNHPFYDKICTKKAYNNRKVFDKQAITKRNSHKEKK